jgi:acylphosphatase
VIGKVQGVFFRASTKAKAKELGLSGWVRNLPDGSVELEAQGQSPKLRKLEEWCHEGPRIAEVSQVACEEIDTIAKEGDFRVKH